MSKEANNTLTTVSVYARHKAGCSKKEDRNWKRCRCRKWLYIFEDGKPTRVTVNTRSWEQAERAAQVERDRRDPVKKKLQEISEHESRKAASQKAKNITVQVATERWLAAQKLTSRGTATIYEVAGTRIGTWATDQGIVNVADITAGALDLWRGLWTKKAEKKYDRLGPTSQSHFQPPLWTAWRRYPSSLIS